MKNILGFLRWQFEGSTKNPSFYGFAVIMLGILASVGGCPAPWPWHTVVVGLSIMFVDTVYSWFRFSYSIYQMEQGRIMRELERKE